ncbi:hypothetical protein BKA62DRAFT_623515 [Auriculariales sp. MPI-PUGE-AT-0066]|nr:hypothetical protein BKA62DRAFT_623515 [Auriculariales sp. MPI-PUGE-AT-0066]
MFSKTAAIATVLSLATIAFAQADGPVPALNPNPKDTTNRRLVGKRFAWRELPFQVDTTTGDRGTQFGYNKCNDTTQGPESKCQTLIVNSIKDFCLWGPPQRGTVGDTEGENVAYCSQPTHGARLMLPGTVKSAQFVKTKSYVMMIGHMDQEKLNIPAGDEGGELDSGGQDERGNPLGAVAYSSALPSAKGVVSQAPMWHAFMGSNIFCMKFCDETAPNASGLCRHTFDTIGCGPNVPADYDALENNGQFGVFLSCDGEDQDPVTPDNTRVPATSNCVPFKSEQIFATGAPAPAPSASSSGTVNPSQTAAPGPGNSQSSSSTAKSPTATTPVPKPGGGGSGTTTPSTDPSASPTGAASANTASMAVVGVVALFAGAVFA